MNYYVECEADRTLLESLGVPRRSIQHRKVTGKGEVVKNLESCRGAVMITDEDPMSARPQGLRSLPMEELPEYHLKIVRSGQNVMVILCPRLEEWLLWLAERSGVRPNKFGLPEDPDELHKVINKRQDSLKKLLASLKEHPASEKVFQKLRALLLEA